MPDTVLDRQFSALSHRGSSVDCEGTSSSLGSHTQILLLVTALSPVPLLSRVLQVLQKECEPAGKQASAANLAIFVIASLSAESFFPTICWWISLICSVSMWVIEKIRTSAESASIPLPVVEYSFRIGDIMFGDKVSLGRNRKSSLCPNIITPDTIPEFCIPPKISSQQELRNTDLRKPTERSTKAPPPEILYPRKEAAACELLKAHVIQVENVDEMPSDNRHSDEESTNADPQSQAALSLPHLAKAQTCYGFCTLLESPNTRRKESLFHSDPSSCSIPQNVPRSRSSSYPRVGSSPSAFSLNSLSARLSNPRVGSSPSAFSLNTLTSRLSSRRSPLNSLGKLDGENISSTDSSPFGSPLLPRSSPKSSLFKTMSQDKLFTRSMKKTGPSRNNSLSTDEGSSTDNSPSVIRRSSETCWESQPCSISLVPPAIFPMELVLYSDRVVKESLIPLETGGNLRLSAEYSPENQRLRVRLISADGLYASSVDPKTISCGVTISLIPGKVQKQRSSIIRKSRNPIFNEDFFFDGISEDDLYHWSVRFKVVNKMPTMKRDYTLVDCDVPLSCILTLCASCGRASVLYSAERFATGLCCQSSATAMVFEALVSDLLNRFIGDYVENLDKSQLKIGIWGGNVVLENLRVKENALSELDVPFKVKAGQVGKLTLKIPWKNLYSEAVVATLDGLYLLVVPGATIKYDAAKEEKYIQEAKQKELQRIEEALQMAAHRGSLSGEFLFNLESYVYKESKHGRKHKKHKKPFKKSKRHEHKKEKSPDEKKDTFAEKLATQVIKNLQIKISSIHIRYEDDLSDPERPLSMGVTLAELSLQTTDENWKTCILNDAAKIIYKLGRLECLCAYWNVDSQIFYRSSWEQIVDKLKAGISTKEQELQGYQYIFKPIFASAKICINPNADVEHKSPKANFYLEVKNIGIEMTKPQYLSMVDLLESIDCMVKNGPYRKFRPDVPVHKHAKQWWIYAINSILEVHIKKVNRMWSWTQILKHRQTLKAYKAAYKAKLTQGKLKEDIEKQIQELEKVLDVFNITLGRQQAQMEVVRSGQKVVGKKSVGQKQGGGGFFSSFFGRKEGKKKEQEESKEPDSIDELMTPEEKAKLYTAIGYSGSSHNLALPKEYVAVIVTFKLMQTSITVREEPNVPEILKVKMIDLSTSISQRPGAQAIKLEAKLGHWYVTGLQQQGSVPSLITSVGDSSSSLLSILFELNPEGSSADQLFRVQSQPVEIIYDAMTVNSMVEFFKSGKGVDLEVITSATLMKLEEIKEKTATGLSHIIETRKILDLRIDLKPSYLLVPKSGFYDEKSDVMILDFGSLQLNSVDQGVHQQVSSSFSSLEEIMDRAYERYSLELTNVQVLYSKSGDVWKSARLQGSSKQHILHPLDFKLQLAKCMVDKDARMPRFKLSGELPLLHVKVSDQKLHGVLDLVNSIPLPQMASTPTTPTKKTLPIPLVDSRTGVLSLGPSKLPDVMETDSDEDAGESSLSEDPQRVTEELTDLQFKFEVKAVLIELTRQADLENTVLTLNVSQLGAQGKMRTYDLKVTSYLRKISLDYWESQGHQNQPLHLISSSDKDGSDLLKVEYIKADTSGPSFQTMFDNTEQTLKVEFSSLHFLMHTRALLSTINYLNTAVPKELTVPRETTTQTDKDVSGKTVFKASKEQHVFSFKMFAMLGSFRVVVCDDQYSIADIIVQGIDASVSVHAKETEVFTRLRDIVVTDVDPKTIHKKAVSIVGEEVFSFKMLLYPGATKGDSYTDTSKVDGKVTLRLGCIRIVYLHKFLVSLLESLSYQYASPDEKFVDNFQTAKEALSAATAQAAEKAASSMRDFAQKSFRLSMDIRLKAPVIIIPQSSVSYNAIEVDLGLITVANSFSLMSVEGFPLPAVVERMDVKLTQLKLSRTILKGSTPEADTEILQPVNLELMVSRNLAASWYTKIPGVKVQGVLKSMNMELGQEDFGVLMKIMVENLGEGSTEQATETTIHEKIKEKVEYSQQQRTAAVSATHAGSQLVMAHGGISQNAINVLINFEVKEVVLKLKKIRNQKECPFLILYVDHVGIDTRMRQYDMCASTYIKKITLKCLEFLDSCGKPLNIVSSSFESGGELLKVQYFKADKNGPDFDTVYKSTEQKIDVKVLLSAINFLSTAQPTPEREPRLKAEDSRTLVSKTRLPASSSEGNVIDLQIVMQLGAFNVLVCDVNSSIADIKVQGIHGSLLMQGTQTHISTRLRDFIVINVDPKTIHKKAISIVGDEVFSFNLSLTPKATEGNGYSDTSKCDGKVKLNVGCIQVLYLHKFFMSLLNFTNNFQTAKEAVTAATAQAAEKAASSVRDFAQKSFRLSMDIRLKAPVIIIPQSSVSHNAVEMDLGLITVANSFSLLPVEDCPLPAVIDEMDVQLTQLKLSRQVVSKDSVQPSIELLEPVNFLLSVKRNLASAWFQKMAAVEVDGDLKPMKVALSQEDLSVLLKILMENLGEAAVLQSDTSACQQVSIKQEVMPSGLRTSKSEINVEEESAKVEQDPVTTIKFNFNIESLALVLYSNDPKQVAPISQHQESLCLGELTLHLMKASGKMFSSGALEVSTILTACTLDDMRTGIQRVTSRMVGKREEDSAEAMVDITYFQSESERTVVAVLQKLYLCASVEFLMAVTDFFIQALPQSPEGHLDIAGQLPLKQISEPKSSLEPKASLVPKTTVRAVIVDPEVVFVANLMKADAPAMVASFQCDFCLVSEDDTQKMRANLKELKVLASPFLRSKKDKAVTTVLRPCSVVLETKMSRNKPLTGCLTVEEVIVKISPVILNTVMTIMAAMQHKPKECQNVEEKSDVSSLWSVMNINECNFWFLGVDTASEITENFSEQDDRNAGETFAVDVKVVQVTLESGMGHHTMPLLLAESSLIGTARNWSSLLNVSADVTLEVNYFNETHAVWEPFIERVDDGTRRWNLKLELKNSPVQDKSPVPGDDFIMLPEPQTAISICSKDTMNITVSKCCLSVFTNLAKAFSEGTASTFDHSLKEKAPFSIRNALGIPLVVQPGANLRLVGTPSGGRLHEVAVGQSVDLEHSVFEPLSRSKLSALQRQESCLFSLSLAPTGYSEITNIPVDKPGRRLYNVCSPVLQEVVSVLVQIDATEGNKVITARSPLQIKNHFSVPFAILKYCTSYQSLVPVGVAEPEKEFHVPLDSYRGQLFLQPVGHLSGQYRESSTCISWKEHVHVTSEVRSVLQCPASEPNFLPLVVNTQAVPDELCFISPHGEQDWDPAYIIHLHPPVTLRNLLPYSIRYLLEGSAETHELQEGNTADVLNACISGEIMELVLVKYQGRSWNSHVKIHKGMAEFFSVCFMCDSAEKLIVDLSMHVSNVGGRLVLSVFSPYWIINKTARVLQYRAEDIHVKHPSDFRDVILFSFRKKNIFSKNKIQLCVSTSTWSDGFSLDTVGSYGCVKCPANNMDYLVGVSIQMSSFNLTRIVTMSPFYTLVNKSSYELEIGEVQNGATVNEKWHYIGSRECLPLWPESTTGKLCVRVVGSELSSKSFFFNKQDNGTLLRMDTYGGIIVDVNISDHSTVISFTDYYDGAAPALIVNHALWITISYKQSGSTVVHELKPGEAQHFAWDDPAAVRKLCWSYAEHCGELDLIKDECGQFACSDHTQIHWVSFLDGRQRVLLFTEDVALVTKARQAEELEQFQQEVNISLQNLGLSLVNNESHQEIAYVGITSSGVVWEMKPKNRWKSFNQKNINLLEKAYQNHLSGKTEPGWVRLESNIEVNFNKVPMAMRQPYSCSIRRNFLSGIQVEFKQSPHQRSLRAQVHWLQVDNQLVGAIFPIVFHPVPPPKSIALDSEPKPFIDISVITRFNEHSQVTQFKYFMALVQEMAVKIDQGFLGAIIALFTPATDPQADKQKNKLIEKDLEALQAELMEASMTDTSGLSFFEHFHISPIKLHLSLSLGSSGDESDQHDMVAIQSVNLLLKSIGATLTDVDDLIFKLAYFEVKYQFYRREKLMWTVIRHYTEQFLKQMYVLVLGLDVLGNPFGLIRGLSEGVEAFFYEPFQGAVQGPEEFAEGFVIGVRSLLGHTVGGAAGMVSRITGSVGKGLAAITMDKEYQQKRREEMNRPPKDFGESLAKGGKGFLKGVVGGVTGIVTKPVEGAKKEGAAGFFKGIGKGLVGVVARPTGGIVDMASSTFQGIQRVAESTEEVTKLRPVRLIREDGIIRPYNHVESKGYDLFQKSEIKQLDGEVFRGHCEYPGHKKTNIIVTNRRVLCVKEIEFVGHFNKEWECLLEHFSRPPCVDGSNLKIYCKEQNKLKIQWKDDQEPVRVLQLREVTIAQKLRDAIVEAQVVWRQHQMVKRKSQRFLKGTIKQ
ncbi:vacuolar protein sorting-associated protein 13C isoform X1 [Arapaima gigas]